MRIDPLDFSQARTAPEDVVRGLEALDPTACLVHLGGTRWLVGKVRPNVHARSTAEQMLDHWTRAVQSGKRLSPQGQQRVRFAQLALLGVRPVDQYTIMGDPDGRIVKEFEASRYRWLHAGNNDLFQQLDDAEDERRANARKDVADIDRAKDAWKYAFTVSHTTSASLTPEDKPRSGFVRHTKPETTHAA